MNIRILRFGVVLYCGLILALIARRALADANSCPTRVTGGKTAQATIHCTDDACEDTGFCGGWQTSKPNVSIWIWQNNQWVKFSTPQFNLAIQYCACIAYSDSGQPYIEGGGCCRAVAVEWGEYSYLGTIGRCGDGCPTGTCEPAPDPAGGEQGKCQ